MRRKLSAVLFALALTVPATGALANEGPYVSLTGMFVMPQDATADYEDYGVKVKYGLKSGGGGAAAVGYDFGTGLRAEVELGYRSVKIEDVKFDSIEVEIDGSDVTFSGKLKVSSKIATFSVMANGLYVLPVDGLPVSPYFGGGLGWAQHKVDDLTFPDLGGIGLEGASAGAFAYQFMAGVKYVIDDIELGAGYRFFGTTEADFDGAKAKVLTHNLEAGVSFRF